MADFNWRAPMRVPDGCEAVLSNITCRNLDTFCGGVPCQQPGPDGERELQLDHIVAKSRNGTNDPYNVGLVCASYNAKKYNKIDPFYSVHSYFDNPINPNALRPHQLDKGYRLVTGEYRELFMNPGVTLDRWMLLAWMVGAGKTVGMLSILFGINAVRKTINGGGVRRIKKVLWLVHQEALVESLVKELESELTKYEICDVNPSVRAVKNKANWNFTSDILVACPQAIWDNNSNGLSEHEIRDTLSKFDAIVVDEGQYAVPQYLHLSDLAPFAFKFCVTATPMNKDGELFCENPEYKPYFALFSSFWYNEGRTLGIYKGVNSFEVGKNRTYHPVCSPSSLIIRDKNGNTVTSEDNGYENNYPKDKFIIEEANRLAESLDKVTGYPNHVMLRVNTIARAKHLVKSLEDHLSITGVWTGSKGETLGSDLHPWMKTKAEEKKKLVKGSKRIVITVDIGQFGINNKYCSIVGWVVPNMSWVEIVQRIGRAIRFGGSDKEFVNLIWDGSEIEFEERLKQCIDYIRDGEIRVSEGFDKLGDFTEGAREVQLPQTAANIDDVTRANLIEEFGKNLTQGKSLNAAGLNTFSDWLDNNQLASESKTDAVKKFIESLSDEGSFNITAGRTLNLPSALKAHHPEIVMESFSAKDFSVDVLRGEVVKGNILYIPGESESEQFRLKIADKLLTDEITLAIARKELSEIHQRSFNIDVANAIPPLKILNGNKEDWKALGVDMHSYAQDLTNQYLEHFLKAGLTQYDASAAFQRKLKTAAAEYFGIFDKNGRPSFSEKLYQPFQKQLSDAMCRQPAIKHIQARAVYLVAKANPEIFNGHIEIFNRLGCQDVE